MSTSVLFSVVIPSYQSESTIERCLGSLIAQDFADWEAVVVDDGSTDQSFAIASHIADNDQRISVIHSPVNRGPGPPSNTGIRHSRGDYLIFLHADDELMPGALSALSEEIDSFNPDLVFFGVAATRNGKTRLLYNQKFADEKMSSAQLDTAESDPRLLLWQPSAWARCYRLAFIKKHNFRLPDGSYEDIPWTLETTLHADSIRVTSAVIYRYRTDAAGTSITTTTSTRSLDRVTQVQRARAIVESQSLPQEVLSHISVLMATHLVWANRAAYRTIPEDLREDFFHSSAEELSQWDSISPILTEKTPSFLMPTRERIAFSKALLANDWSRWTTTRSQRKRALKWQRYLDPARWGLFKQR